MSVLIEPVVRSFTIQTFDGTASGLNNSALYALNAIKECLTRVDGKNRYWTLDTSSLGGQGFSNDVNGNIEKIIIKNSYSSFDNTTKHQKISLRSIDDSTTALNRYISVKLFPNDYLSEGIDSEITLPTTKTFSTVASNYESLITGGQYTTSPTYDYYTLSTIKRGGDASNTDGFIIETPDAISIIFKNNSVNILNWNFGMHGGIIYTPIDLNDYKNFIDGSGILVGFVGLGFYVCMYCICIDVCINVCVYVCMYVCMCVCMRVYACSESFKTAIGCAMYLAMCMCVYVGMFISAAQKWSLFRG
jgi:hypothetical protein